MGCDILKIIAERTRIRVAEKKKAVSLEEIKEKACSMDREPGFPFEKALRNGDIGFICECKRASPSKGVISEEFPYVKIAKEYEAAGADCISVLTEPDWFLGEEGHLKEIAAAVSLPCLRKDFTVDEYMIYEAKRLGASAILIICSLLDLPEIGRFIEIADGLGLSALVEAHNEDEISSALKAGARLIGVNNRDLRDFSVDIYNSVRLRGSVPKDILFVAESGIKTRDDVEMLRKAGVNGILSGEALMRAGDKKAMLEGLRGRL